VVHCYLVQGNNVKACWNNELWFEVKAFDCKISE